jgi:hypothetical protein
MCIRKVKVKGLGVVEYYLWGEDPVNALGEIRRNEFQFEATGGNWKITVTEWGKVRTFEQGKASGLGPMPHAEAASIVESFIREYALID